MAVEVIAVPEQNLVIERFRGRLKAADLYAMKNEEIERGLLNPTMRTITDVRGCEVTLTPAEIVEFAAWHRERASAQAGSLAVIIASGSLPTALSMLAARRMQSENNMSVYSTPRAALSALGLTVDDVVHAWPEARD